MKKNILIVIVLIIISFPAVFSLFHSGFYQVHDNTQVSRVFEMAKSLKNGMFPVRWVNDLGYGYGYSIFNFYAPLPYYIGAVFTVLGINVLVATKIMIVIPILLSAVTMFFFVRALTDEFSALCASFLYVYFPYHAVDVYIRGDIGELYAYALYPLVALSLYKIGQLARKKKYTPQWIFWLSISLTAVIISHNLSAYMLMLFFLPACFICLLITKNKRTFFSSLLISGVITFLLASFYMLPALAEMKYTNVVSQVGGGANFQDHFVCLNQLWNSPWGYGGSTKGCLDGFSFKLGKINVITVLLDVIFAGLSYPILYRKNKKVYFLLCGTLIGLLFSLFLMMNMSEFIWNTLPQMAFLQYPWRFLAFAGFFISASIGLGLYLLRKRNGFFISCFISLILILFTFISNAKLFAPQAFNEYPSSYYTNLSYIRWDVSKISDEYLPQHFLKPASEQQVPKEKFAIVNGLGEIGNITDKTQMLSARTVFVTDAIVDVHTAPFPAWNAFLDGKRIDYASSKTGIRLIVPSGPHVISLKYQSTPIESLGNTLSILGIICCFFAIIKSIHWHYGTKKTS